MIRPYDPFLPPDTVGFYRPWRFLLVIECILIPIFGVVEDVFRNAIIGLVIANNVFIVIALPNISQIPI